MIKHHKQGSLQRKKFISHIAPEREESVMAGKPGIKGHTSWQDRKPKAQIREQEEWCGAVYSQSLSPGPCFLQEATSQLLKQSHQVGPSDEMPKPTGDISFTPYSVF